MTAHPRSHRDIIFAGVESTQAIRDQAGAGTGLSIYLQAGFADPAAVKGVSLTQGLEMEIG